MKTHALIIASLSLALCGVGSAFTLGFESVALGTTVPGTLIINVSGYGDVQFDAVGAATFVIGNDYENDSPTQTTSPSLNFDSGEQVKVTFLGNDPTNVTFSFVGANAGEFFVTTAGANAKEFFIQLNGTAFEPQNNGAGLYQIGFQQVPEPSAALLGVIGASMMVLRRRR